MDELRLDLAALVYDPDVDPGLRRRAVALLDPARVAALALDEEAPLDLRLAAAARLPVPASDGQWQTVVDLAEAGDHTLRRHSAYLAGAAAADPPSSPRRTLLWQLAADEHVDVVTTAIVRMDDAADLLATAERTFPPRGGPRDGGEQAAAEQSAALDRAAIVRAVVDRLASLRDRWAWPDAAATELRIFAVASRGAGAEPLAAALVDPHLLAFLGTRPALDRLANLLGGDTADRAARDPLLFRETPARLDALLEVAACGDEPAERAAVDLLLRSAPGAEALAALGRFDPLEHEPCGPLAIAAEFALRHPDDGVADRAAEHLLRCPAGRLHLAAALLGGALAMPAARDALWADPVQGLAAGSPAQRALAEAPLHGDLTPRAAAAAAGLLLDPWALALLAMHPAAPAAAARALCLLTGRYRPGQPPTRDDIDDARYDPVPLAALAVDPAGGDLARFGHPMDPPDDLRARPDTPPAVAAAIADWTLAGAARLAAAPLGGDEQGPAR